MELLKLRRLTHKKPVFSIAEIKAIRQRIRDILAIDDDALTKQIDLWELEREFNSSNVIKAMIFELVPNPHVTVD